MDHTNAAIACRPRPAPLARAVARLGNDRIAALEQLLEMSRGLGRAHVARCRDRLHLSSDPAARRQLIADKAATATLERRGVPSGAAGQEARAAMETIRRDAEAHIDELLEEACSGARVFQGGGNEVVGSDLGEMVREAAEHALQRLYPKFYLADHPGWDKVYAQAKRGTADALKAVGDDGEPGKHLVCKTVLDFIAREKRGAEVRAHFEGPPYGWQGDAVEGALQVLLVAGLLRAQDERGRPIEPRELDRRQIGKVTFKLEAATVSTPQRIQIRKLMQMLDVHVNNNEELRAVPAFLDALSELAERAGGAPPRPVPPETEEVEAVRLASGNEQLLTLYERREALREAINAWHKRAEQIAERLPAWEQLLTLLKHANAHPVMQDIQEQATVIENQRQLIEAPNPIGPLLKEAESRLRKVLTGNRKRYADELAQQLKALKRDDAWTQLSKQQQRKLLKEAGVAPLPEWSLSTHEELLEALEQYPLSIWDDRIAALSHRFAQVKVEAIKAVEPTAQRVELPKRTLKSEADVEEWVQEVQGILQARIKDGPIVF